MIGFGDALNLVGAVSGAISGGGDRDESQGQGRQDRQQNLSVRDAYEKCQQAIRDQVPAGREQALALTNLQQSAMWARAAIEGER